MSQARSKAAAALGRIKSPAKTEAARENSRRAIAARMQMTPEQRQDQARKAARARWGGPKADDQA